MANKPFTSLSCFYKDETGAVTVDWVILTAAVVGLAILVVVPIAAETESVTQSTKDYIDGIPVGFMTE